VKTQSKGPGQKAPATPEALDEKITHITEDLVKGADRFKVPVIVILVGIVAVIAIMGIVGKLKESQEMAWSEEIYQLFENDDAGIRANAPVLIAELEGKRIEPALVTRYALWLFEQNQGNDRADAVALVAAAQERHPEDLLLSIAQGELTTAYEGSKDFELPPIPEPVPPTVLPGDVTPILPGGQTNQVQVGSPPTGNDSAEKEETTTPPATTPPSTTTEEADTTAEPSSSDDKGPTLSPAPSTTPPAPDSGDGG